jgi:hypothetical protein
MNTSRPTASYLRDKKILALSQLDDQELLDALQAIATPTLSLRQFLKDELPKRPSIYNELAYAMAKFAREE